MELFYAEDAGGGFCRLDGEESGHCVRVLRHRSGDVINVMDGHGALLRCRIVDDSPKSVVAEILSRTDGWNAHPYRLTMAVCPTKNIDRFEWFAEKATEIGVDAIVPLTGDRSERRVVKTGRIGKIVLSAAKQSLKAAVPEVAEPLSVREFIACAASGGTAGGASCGPLRLVACCFEDEGHPRRSVKEVLGLWLSENFPEVMERKRGAYVEDAPGAAVEAGLSSLPDITVLIGPEGDFSQEEVQAAVSAGFIPVHLGPSRLRTETAALVCTEAVYDALML